MKQALRLFPILALLFVLGCKKEPAVNSGNNHPSVEELKKWAYFKVGTYWVYEEKNTGARDSVYVTSANTGVDTIYENGEIADIWPWFVTHTFSTYEQQAFEYTFTQSWNGPCNGTDLICAKVFRNKWAPSFHQTTFFLFEIHLGSWLYVSAIGPHCSGTVTTTEVLDSINVSGNVFENTVVMENTCDATEDSQMTKYLHTERVGLIRKELVDSGKVWNLIQYNIVQ